MSHDINIEVSRSELLRIQDALETLQRGSDAEAQGDSVADSEAASAGALLADYLENEGERAADIMVAVNGVHVLVETILEANKQRMLEALMGAVAGVVPVRKVEALRGLVAVARVPRHLGRVAGSGVLGLVSAIAVQPKHPAHVRALAFEAVGLLAAGDGVVDPDPHGVMTSLSDPAAEDTKRTEEFQKLRSQVVSVGAIDALIFALQPSQDEDQVRLCLAAATALANLLRHVDVSERMLASQYDALKRTMKLILEVHSPPSSSTPAPSTNADGGDEGGDDTSEDEDEFDYSFAWERPALRVMCALVGSLSSMLEHGKSAGKPEFADFAERLCSIEVVDALCQCVSGEARRGAEHRASVQEVTVLALKALAILARHGVAIRVGAQPQANDAKEQAQEGEEEEEGEAAPHVWVHVGEYLHDHKASILLAPLKRMLTIFSSVELHAAVLELLTCLTGCAPATPPIVIREGGGGGAEGGTETGSGGKGSGNGRRTEWLRLVLSHSLPRTILRVVRDSYPSTPRHMVSMAIALLRGLCGLKALQASQAMPCTALVEYTVRLCQGVRVKLRAEAVACLDILSGSSSSTSAFSASSSSSSAGSGSGSGGANHHLWVSEVFAGWVNERPRQNSEEEAGAQAVEAQIYAHAHPVVNGFRAAAVLRTVEGSMDLGQDTHSLAHVVMQRVDRELFQRHPRLNRTPMSEAFAHGVNQLVAKEGDASPERLKAAGNALFERKLYSDALALYTACLSCVAATATGGEGEAEQALADACRMNIARCYLKLQDEPKCLAACEEAEKCAAPGSRLAASHFIRAQLFWHLSGSSDKHGDRNLPPRFEQKRLLKSAVAELGEVMALKPDDRASKVLLSAVKGGLRKLR